CGAVGPGLPPGPGAGLEGPGRAGPVPLQRSPLRVLLPAQRRAPGAHPGRPGLAGRSTRRAVAVAPRGLGKAPVAAGDLLALPGRGVALPALAAFRALGIEGGSMEAAGTHAAALEAHWGGGVSPFGATWQKTMMWIFIVTDGLLFSGLLSGYAFLRMSSLYPWPERSHVFSIPFIALMTFILI